MSSSPHFQRIILPIGGPGDDDLLAPATILTHWFGAHLQLVTTEADAVADHEQTAAGLGVPISPVALVAGGDVDELSALAGAVVPSVVVARADPDGLDLALRMPQATFLLAAQEVSDGRSHRLAAGPLVVPLVGTDSDLDAVALAATWAITVDLQVRLVVDLDDAAATERTTEARAAQTRLTEMGIEATVDRLRSDRSHPALALGRTNGATALVIAADNAAADELIDGGNERGLSLLVAPVTEARSGRTGPVPVASAGHGPEGPVGPMDERECRELLAGATVARLGYVIEGRPQVVPVNITVVDGDVFIRSLPGSKAAAAGRGDVVCLEVDHLEPETMTGWSVTAHGPLELIVDARVLRRAWDNDPEPWQHGDRWRWLRLTPQTLAGARVAGGVGH